MDRKSLLCTLALLLGLPGVSATAQLPALEGAANLSGKPTTARFFAGVSADNGVSFAHSFAADQAIDILTEIRVENGHVDSRGNLYVIIHLDGAFFMRQSDGAYVPWDLNLSSLKPIRPAQALSASESIVIIDSVAFAALGITGVTLDLFLGYDSQAASGDLFFTGQALSFAIEEVPVQPDSFALYQQAISGPVVQANCFTCHRSGGLASASALRYAGSATSGFQQQNYNTLLDYIQAGGGSLLKSKPQGGNAHGGGIRLFPGSAALSNWIEFVEAAAAQ